MPNWCSNKLRVSGPNNDLAQFIQQAIGHNPWNTPPKEQKPCPLNFHSLVPIPVDVLTTDHVLARHDWEAQHWGCRFGACDVKVMDEDLEYIVYEFRTAWAPAVEFIRNVRQHWPSLTFTLDYEEEGTRSIGVCTAQAENFNNHHVRY